jgi:hypothetical protein
LIKARAYSDTQVKVGRAPGAERSGGRSASAAPSTDSHGPILGRRRSTNRRLAAPETLDDLSNLPIHGVPHLFAQISWDVSRVPYEGKPVV